MPTTRNLLYKMNMNTCCSVTLADGQTTNVLLADDIYDLSAHLSEYGNNVLWVLDGNTARLIRPLPTPRVILEPGESAKNWRGTERILRAAVEEGMARDGRFIGFGGGVICDMTAFAASLYMRGCRLTLVPTTLLAMVDASLGGKTAIDFMGGKNLVGTFYPAQDVLICCDTLKSLSDKEFLNGLAEVIKHALLAQDEELYRMLLLKKHQIMGRDPAVLRNLVELSLKVKQSYIERDPKETLGIRQALNLGHTFGHALESCGRFTTWSHGAAVAWGTCRALEAGEKLGITDQRYASGATKLFAMYGYDIDYRIGRGDWQLFRQSLLKDKKKQDGMVRFVLLEGQGRPVLSMLETPLLQSLVISSPI